MPRTNGEEPKPKKEVVRRKKAVAKANKKKKQAVAKAPTPRKRPARKAKA